MVGKASGQLLSISNGLELAENPNLGKPYNQIVNGLLGFKFGEHVIFYQIVDSHEIEIVRILHGKMDLKSKFF